MPVKDCIRLMYRFLAKSLFCVRKRLVEALLRDGFGRVTKPEAQSFTVLIVDVMLYIQYSDFLPML